VPEPPLHRVRRLSYSALALFERCSYRYYAERVAGLRPGDGRAGGDGDGEGLLATEIGDAAHRLLELVDLREPVPPDATVVRSWYPRVTDEELARIEGHVAAYCSSTLARRVASLPGAEPERPFAFEHDGVLLHGRLDVLALDATRGFVLDYKTNVLGDHGPEEVVEEEYRLQRLVYALVCFRAGAEEVEVAYSFLERPDEPVSTTFTRADLPELEAALSEAIARIDAGDFRPTPSDFACAGCPALDVVCAGPRLRRSPPRPPALAAAG
jgi:RecB family exonuclease